MGPEQQSGEVQRQLPPFDPVAALEPGAELLEFEQALGDGRAQLPQPPLALRRGHTPKIQLGIVCAQEADGEALTEFLKDLEVLLVPGEVELYEVGCEQLLDQLRVS